MMAGVRYNQPRRRGAYADALTTSRRNCATYLKDFEFSRTFTGLQLCYACNLSLSHSIDGLFSSTKSETAALKPYLTVDEPFCSPAEFHIIVCCRRDPCNETIAPVTRARDLVPSSQNIMTVHGRPPSIYGVLLLISMRSSCQPQCSS